jgi:putative transposase
MSHRYRLYPDSEQLALLVQHCRDARFVWNLALEQSNLWRRGRPRVDMAAWDRQLAEARQVFDWLASGSSSVQQGALRDLRQAFRNWWKRPDHFRRPRWRKADVDEGFVVRDLTVTVVNHRWAAIHIPKAGTVKFRLSRPLPPDAKSARVTRDRSGRWHVAIVARPATVERSATGCEVGVDLGIATTVTLSSGECLRLPALLSTGETQRKRRSQRRLARQRPGSNRRARTTAAIAVLSAREADRRRDWIEDATTNLVRRFDVIVVEDLQVRNMMRSAAGTLATPGRNVAQKRGLNRAIHSQAWSMFRRRLTDKTTAAGVTLVAVNPAHTSQRCHACGHPAPENRKSQAVFCCIECGHQANADVNAANNILAAGRAVTGRGGTAPASAQRPDETSTTQVAA